MKKTALILVLLAAYNVHAQDTTVEINFKFDPCSLKECAMNEVCRVVDHAQLLEIPVAACVKSNTRPVELAAGQCKTLRIGSNILNCKTVSEWILLGHTQCSLEEEEMMMRYELDKRSVKTKYVCHQKSDEEFKFLSAEFDCCKKETPSVLTVATPGTTTASGRPIEDGWITEEDGPSPTDGEHMIQEEMKSTDSISLPLTEEPSVQDTATNVDSIPIYVVNDDAPVMEDQGEDENGGSNNADTIREDDTNEDDGITHGLLFLVVFIIAGCVIFVIGLGAYIRFLAKNNSQTNKKVPTVFVNQNCDEYKTVFEAEHHDKEPILRNIYF